jgi:hypothetical protein
MDSDPAEDIDERSMAALIIFDLSAAFEVLTSFLWRQGKALT